MKLKFTQDKAKGVVVQGVSMSTDQKAKLEHLAKHYGVNRSQVVQQMIEQAHQSISKPKRRK